MSAYVLTFGSAAAFNLGIYTLMPSIWAQPRSNITGYLGETTSIPLASRTIWRMGMLAVVPSRPIMVAMGGIHPPTIAFTFSVLMSLSAEAFIPSGEALSSDTMNSILYVVSPMVRPPSLFSRSAYIEVTSDSGIPQGDIGPLSGIDEPIFSTPVLVAFLAGSAAHAIAKSTTTMETMRQAP